MGRPGTGAMAPPAGGNITNPGQPPNAMLPPPGGTPPPPGVGPNANLQRGPMGIPGYTPGSVVGGQPPQGGAPPIMMRNGPSQAGGNSGQTGAFRFPPRPMATGPQAPIERPGFPLPGPGEVNGSINTLPTPNHSANPGVGG